MFHRLEDAQRDLARERAGAGNDGPRETAWNLEPLKWEYIPSGKLWENHRKMGKS